MPEDLKAKYEEILNRPTFDKLEVQTKEMITSLMKNLEGKGSMESFAILSDFVKKMPKSQKLSEEALVGMMEALVETMPESDRSRFKSIMKVLEGMKS